MKKLRLVKNTTHDIWVMLFGLLAFISYKILKVINCRNKISFDFRSSVWCDVHQCRAQESGKMVKCNKRPYSIICELTAECLIVVFSSAFCMYILCILCATTWNMLIYFFPCSSCVTLSTPPHLPHSKHQQVFMVTSIDFCHYHCQSEEFWQGSLVESWTKWTVFLVL